MTDPTQLSARECAARIARGELSAERLMQALLARVQEREPQVRAWEWLDPQQALAAARASDAGAAPGPLRGVPVALKDLIDTADMPTAYGSPIYAGHRPRTDAACVARLKQAGAIAMGKTVMTEFASFHPGRTANPHNPAHTPGGSSSGSAAAVAAGMAPVALGTQTAGSVIRPAAFCGVVGYMPSGGLLNRVGVKMISDSLDTLGVFARSVDDAAFLVSVLAERPELDAAGPARAPRLGLYRTPEWARAEPATEAALARAQQALQRAGSEVGEPRDGGAFDGLAEAHACLMQYEIARSLLPEWLSHREQFSAALRRIMETGLAFTAQDYDAARAAVARARAALDGLFGDCDALLVPAAPGEAPRGLDATGDPVFNRMWTALRAPCVGVPAGAGPQGLPVAVQVVGRPGDDARTLWVARAVEAALAG